MKFPQLEGIIDTSTLTPAEQIMMAAMCYGTGSPKHIKAIRKFSPPDVKAQFTPRFPKVWSS